jgi:hypothetical protein
MKCGGSGNLAKFDPRPNENQHFKATKAFNPGLNLDRNGNDRPRFA